MLNPSAVFFADAGLDKTVGGPTQKFHRLLDKSGFAGIISRGDVVAVKMHFGEPGNARYIRPIFPVIAVDFIKKCGGRPFVTDTTVVYNTERKDFFQYLNAARRNGFTNETLGCPLIISGGIRDHGVKVEVPDPLILPEVTVSQDIWEADVLFSLAHFTMHLGFPLAAALKNISMGCVDQATKSRMHSVKGMKPFHLNAQAANTDGAKALLNRFQGKFFACNLVLDVTPECDCFGKTDLPIVPDIGFFASFDPAACDQASFDAVTAAPGYPGCLMEGTAGMNPGGDKVSACHANLTTMERYQEFIRKSGVGSLEYELVDICTNHRSMDSLREPSQKEL